MNHILGEVNPMLNQSLSSINTLLDPLDAKMNGVYVFFVDASNPMLLQNAPFGDWSRIEASTQLISRQLFNLTEADGGKDRYNFLIVGFNARRAVVGAVTPTRLSKVYGNPNKLASFLLSRLQLLGGSQDTNKGLILMKGIYDDLKKKGMKGSSLPKPTPRIKLLLFTDAGDARERDLVNPFAGKRPDPLVGIFVGANKQGPGWVMLRKICSKCQKHPKRQLFSLDGFESFSELESIEFLSFDKNRYSPGCPTCLQKKISISSPKNRNLILSTLDEPMKLSTKAPSYKRSHGRMTTELLITAGPRKDDDVALGEDAGGVIMGENMASFWVADGTSESPVVCDFSSRNMAQELGNHFVEELSRIPENELISRLEHEEQAPVSMMLEKAFISLLRAWSKRLDGFLNSDNGRKTIDTFFELDGQNMNLNSLTHFEFIDFSTTFLCGLVSKSGTGQVACIGDCPFCVGGINGLRVYRLSNSRIFARLRRLSDGYRFDPVSVSEDIAVQRFTKASIVIAGSDGIGRLPEFLKEQMKSFSWAEIRKRIHRFIPNTHDDKTLCVIHIGEK